jgi:hypothetical protein
MNKRLKGRTKKASVLTPIEDRSDLFKIVCSFEDDVRAVEDFAKAIAIMSEAIEGSMALSFQRLAWEITDRIQDVEEKRGMLFHMTHENRRSLSAAAAAIRSGRRQLDV